MRNEHDEYREFIRGVAKALKCDTVDADAHWAAFSRQISDSEREEIEQGGFDAGVENGNAILALQ